MRQEYHIAVRIERDTIRVSALLAQSGRRDLPITTLAFTPTRSMTSYPVMVYWKSQPPAEPAQIIAVERAVLNYCARLFLEAAYEGPVDCCL